MKLRKTANFFYQDKEGSLKINKDLMSPRTRFIFEEFPSGKLHSFNKDKLYSDEEKAPWYSIFKPKLNDRTALQKFLFENQGNEISVDEFILDDFSCAAKLKILIQGSIYVSNKALYFYSRFNDANILFGKKTKLKILLSDIVMMKKDCQLGIFDNTIKFKLKNSLKMTLTSFLNRDECFNLIWALWIKLKGVEIDPQTVENQSQESSESFQLSVEGSPDKEINESITASEQ